jgi:sulfur-oxidizing protein SoxZ
MASKMKIRAKLKGETVEVKALMNHPMETGLRKDKKTGEVIPAHFIQEVVAKTGDKTVMTALWSGGVSKNPYIAFKFAGGAKGEKVDITWTDNKGESETASAEIK